MKLLNKKEGVFLNKKQQFWVFAISTALIFILYLVGSICSKNGITTFLFSFDNSHLIHIENWLKERNIFFVLTQLFSTLEFYACLWYSIGKKPKWYYLIFYYLISIFLGFLISNMPAIVWFLYPIICTPIFSFIDILISKKKFVLFDFIFKFATMAMCLRVNTVMITTLSCGKSQIPFDNNLSLGFVVSVSLELVLTLLVNFYFFWLLVNINKLDSIPENTPTSKRYNKLLKTLSHRKEKKQKTSELSKEQRVNIYKVRIKFIATQVVSFTFLFTLAFFVDKIIEFSVMYLSFFVIRYILGYKYSMHFMKESIWSIAIFGGLIFFIPGFNLFASPSIIFGVVLAIISHTFYKYRGMCMFMDIASKDRYADLFVELNGNTSELNIRTMAQIWELDKFHSDLLVDYMQKGKLTYLAYKYNYSDRQINYELDEIVKKIKNCTSG